VFIYCTKALCHEEEEEEERNGECLSLFFVSLGGPFFRRFYWYVTFIVLNEQAGKVKIGNLVDTDSFCF